MKPHKHVVKHTTKLIRGMSATYQCTVHVQCQHAFKLVEKSLPDSVQWTLSELNTHSAIPAPKPRGIDPAIRAKVDEFAILGASPMHILESLSALADFKDAELPTRDQISNRIHGRESKKRKLQMEAAIGCLARSNSQTSSPLLYNQPLPPIIEPIPSLREYEFQNSDAIEQAYLDMFGPQLLYHSVYYQEYGLGMVVSSPIDVCVPPLNITYQTPGLSTIEPPGSHLMGSPLKVLSNPAVPPIPDPVGTTQSGFEPSPPKMKIQDSPGLIPNSVPLAGSSIPISIHSIYPPQWTLFFLNTPPDENGLYLQCPLGCPGCVKGRIHLLVNRTLLLAGLMGAVDLANGGNGNGNPSHQTNLMGSRGSIDGQLSTLSQTPVFMSQT